jgi:hypothetical protein
MDENKVWRSRDKRKRVRLTIELDLDKLEDMELCLKYARRQLLEGVPYVEDVIGVNTYYKASLDFVNGADFREEEIDGKIYRVIIKKTNTWND